MKNLLKNVIPDELDETIDRVLETSYKTKEANDFFPTELRLNGELLHKSINSSKMLNTLKSCATLTSTTNSDQNYL